MKALFARCGRWWCWLGLAGAAVAGAAEPVGMKAYDFRYLPQLRACLLYTSRCV